MSVALTDYRWVELEKNLPGAGMGVPELQRTEWLDAALWEQLEQLESRHRRAQWEHRLAQRDLQRLIQVQGETPGLHQAWQRYCEMIAELDRTTEAIESLRTCASRTSQLVP